ncbi:tyrosine-protein phosphatase [Paenibacillus sp. NEAU-GSW1]|uniref:tyrosine-protein phosphatase n=1 Tax=Paenibacillus sp. NEAU-GSW1 TaxID=2682486 RepID=UPI0012E14387|nr:CpsB/CapC family capsule biosynthesis tyrosine phosphatase [Paenibacillus sp. NEAU-GSW1]MUT65077.1 protein tyrosine phosphatase [Paenibacillus sp. NEAU-GSW1]
MIDIHSHLLPGLDDGAADWNEAMALAAAASAEGITDIIATPHHFDGRYNNSAAKVNELVNTMNAMLTEQQIPLTVHSGQEIHVHHHLLNNWDNGLLLPLAGSKYVLLEMPSSRIPEHMDQLVYELKLAGISAVIAHPERNAEIVKHPERLAELIALGAYAQVTSHSLVGGFGRTIERAAWHLCRHRLIHFIASDAHHLEWRGFRMKEAFERAAGTLGEQWSDYYARNAARLLQSEEIAAAPSEASLPRSGGWDKLKSLFRQ